MSAGVSRPVFGIRFSLATNDEIVREICQGKIERSSGAKLLVTTNLYHVVTLRKNSRFREAYARAWKVTIDGAPVYLYARCRGAAVPERITGADLFPDILRTLSPDMHRPFFVAAQQQTADRLTAWLVGRGFTAEQIAAVVPPFGFDRDAGYSASLAEKIRQHGTTHLFFGLGIPKSEIWIDQNRAMLGDLYAFAFGAGLEFFAGVTKRAPLVFRKCGMEWLWRVLQEPRRLFRRYFVDSWPFFIAIADDIRFNGNLPEARLPR
ncbi:WecB/TagA/CpsF family glycosyltransferase [Dongia soli]|uniref:WecB/TagA/CpsF family glycosyltransferase n=1 Tax=Dongia soli TaxID=600628 RepID=A0ABU5EEJ1_9PROT|nr:WecB/TagA/CpsF family glycosyltransferase [Dongia soli]MDY0884259.1 WecB/TagA/CpsF family glycosyltransferase [Dongia soli]